MVWTKEAAVERMRLNRELQRLCGQFPLARVVVESAARVWPYPGYHFDRTYSAYKDWLDVAVLEGSEVYRVCLSVIIDLLPEQTISPLREQDDEEFEEFEEELPPPVEAIGRHTEQVLPGLPSLPWRGHAMATVEEALMELSTTTQERSQQMRAILQRLADQHVADE